MAINYNSNCNVIMAHEIPENIWEVPKSKFDGIDLITFDDGLLSQFEARQYFKELNIPCVFFVSSSIIRPSHIHANFEFIKCHDAHLKAFSGNFENYMSINQIRTLQYEGFEIGCHGHLHARFKNLKEFKNDLHESLEFFEAYNIKIQKYCWPYNQHFPLGSAYLKIVNLQEFGDGRIPIELKIFN